MVRASDGTSLVDTVVQPADETSNLYFAMTDQTTTGIPLGGFGGYAIVPEDVTLKTIQMFCLNDPANNLTFDLSVNGSIFQPGAVTNACTIASGQKVSSLYTYPSPVNIAKGAVLSLTNNTTADPSIAGISLYVGASK